MNKEKQAPPKMPEKSFSGRECNDRWKTQWDGPGYDDERDGSYNNSWY